nr:hypothetical protein [Tanacetum cinerariifolium]
MSVLVVNLDFNDSELAVCLVASCVKILGSELMLSHISELQFALFWDTIRYDSTTGIYSCQLDEQWFNLYKDILKDSLQITPINDNDPFVAPPLSDVVIKYINTLGYPCTLRNVSAKTSCASDSLGYHSLLQHRLCSKRSKAGLVGKRRKPKSPLKLVDEFADEGPARPVVFRELDYGRFQLLPETPKKKSPVNQYIFQRRTPMTIGPSDNAKSLSLDADLADSETKSDKTVTPVNKEKDASNRELTEINAGDTSSVPPITTLVLDLITSQSNSPTVNAPLLTSTATTTTITTTTLPPPPPQPQQSTTDSILLQRIGELEQHIENLIHDKLALEERLDKHGSRLYNLENLNIPQKVSKAVDVIFTDAVDWAMQAPLRDCFCDMSAVDIKEILQQRMFEDNSYQAHDDHNNLFEALQKSLEHDYSNQLLADLDEARRKKRKKHDLPRTPSGSPPLQPPPPLPLAGASGALGTSGALGSSQFPPPFLPHLLIPTEAINNKVARLQVHPNYLMNDDLIPDEHVHLSDDEDTRNDHLPKADIRKDWWKPLLEEERLATPEPAWTIPSSNVSDVENN